MYIFSTAYIGVGFVSTRNNWYNIYIDIEFCVLNIR
jgi:hypothetical protein